MSSGTTEGLDGEIEYEPFIPTNPTIEQPTVEMSPGGPSEPLPPPPPTQPVPAPKGRGTKRAALLRWRRRRGDRRARRRWHRRHARQRLVELDLCARRRRSAPSGSSGSSGSGSQSAPTSSSAQTPTGPEGVAPTMDIRAVLRKVEPSVVAIETGLVSQNGGIFGRGAGTGVIISDDGLVLTNNHVIEQAGSIKVKLADGRELNADLVGSSPADDVALIKIRDVSGLTAAELGNSSDLEVGDEVVAIGNALDLEGTPTVTRGIVSRAQPFDRRWQRVARQPHPDRRGDQPRQLGRSARERRRVRSSASTPRSSTTRRTSASRSPSTRSSHSSPTSRTAAATCAAPRSSVSRASASTSSTRPRSTSTASPPTRAQSSCRRRPAARLRSSGCRKATS